MYKKILLVVLVAIVFLLLYAAYGRKNLVLPKSVVKERYTTPISKFLNWKGNEIHYTDDGKGFPVLMIHGLGGSTRDFRYLDSLMNDQYRIIRVDLPGFGLSDFPKITEKDPDYNKMYAEFFNYFLDTLHLDSMYVAGNSMGGMAAWALAVNHPEKVKKLVLLNSAGYDMEKVIKVATQIFHFNSARAFFKRGLPPYLTKLGIENCFYDKNVVTDDKVQMVNDMWNREGSMDVIFDLATTSKFLDTSMIKKVSCPTLILWGSDDKIVPPDHAERFHRDIKNSRVIIYPQCGHVPMVEHPVEVQKDMLKFFSGQ